jgi:5-(hydroxymethyl)furfural/furfural oxidase
MLIADGDMFVVAISKSAWHAVGERIASFLIAVYHTYSERGQGQAHVVRLARRAAGRIQSSF